MSPIFKQILFIIIIIFVVIFAFWKLIVSPEVNKALVQGYIENKQISETISISHQSGNLKEGLELDNIELTNLKYLPFPNMVKIQKAFINLTALNLQDLKIEVENVRIFLPDSEPIVVNGSLDKNALNFNIFSNKVGLEEIQELIPPLKKFQKVAGRFRNVDLFLKGTPEEPALSGTLTIESLAYNRFVLEDCPVEGDIVFKSIKPQLELYGYVHFDHGLLRSPKDVSVLLSAGKLDFKGDPKNPHLNIYGESVIDKIKITLSLKGSKQEPELTLTSEPSLPEKHLMLMMVTGKRWKGLEETYTEGTLSPDITKDFIDYFIFGGRGNVLAERFGLYDINIIFEEGKRGISAKKDVSPRFAVGYGVEQEEEEGGQTTTLQKFQGDYKLTDDVTFSFERELNESSVSEGLESELEEPIPNDKVLLKYKKSF